MNNPIDWARIGRLQQTIRAQARDLGYELCDEQLLGLVQIVYEDPRDNNETIAFIRRTLQRLDEPTPGELLFLRLKHAAARGLVFLGSLRRIRG